MSELPDRVNDRYYWLVAESVEIPSEGSFGEYCLDFDDLGITLMKSIPIVLFFLASVRVLH